MSVLCEDQDVHLKSECEKQENLLKESLKSATTLRASLATLLKCEDKLEVITKGLALLRTQNEKHTLQPMEAVVFKPKPDNMAALSDMIGQIEVEGIAIPNPFDAEQTSDILGSLRRGRELKLNVSFRISQTAGVLQTRPSVTDQALVVCWAEHAIYCVVKTGEVVRSVPLKTEPSAISFNNGNIFVASFLEKRVFRINSDDTQDNLFETELHPHGMCCFSNETLLVTLVEHGDHKPSDCSQRLLRNCTLDGKQVITVERDTYGKRFFNWPVRVRKNRFNNLVVIVNETGTESSHLVLFDGNLGYKLRYLGKGNTVYCDQDYNPDDINADFYVEDVDFDSSNNMILAEYHSKSVQLLDSYCNRIISVASFPETIWSLAIHQNGEVWLGLENGVMNIMSDHEKNLDQRLRTLSIT